MRTGAIDIGSNSIRLLVADVDETDGAMRPLEVIARAGEMCRLARGLDQGGTIDDALAERAGHLATEFAHRARSLGAKHIVVGATAALRNARNGSEVARVIGDRTGLPVRILTGDEEAQLVYRAVVLGLGHVAARSACLVFDIGGGSTEIVSGFGVTAGRWASLPFGAVSLTERFLRSDPPTAHEIDCLEADVSREIMHQCAYMPEKAPLLAGVGGTITVLASMDRGLASYQPSEIEGWCIRPERLLALVDRLVGARGDERRVLPVAGEGRADIVAAGALVVRLILGRFPSPGLLCSTQGLRYALARLAAEEMAHREHPPGSET